MVKVDNPPSPGMAKAADTDDELSSAAPPRLMEVAYQAILKGLFAKKIAAGAFFSQSDLVRMTGVPIQPLRDALRVLETEGVLRIHPRSGVEFFKADFEFVRSTYQFRTILERSAIRGFAEQCDPQVIQTLLTDHLELLRKIEREGLFHDIRTRLQELEHRLHGGIIAVQQNPFIESAFRRLNNYTTLIMLDRPETPPLIKRTLQEHIRVLEACVAGDADLAEAELAAHLNAALHRILRL
jgi:DNA-binding GntR family transcriptional regulator